MRNLNIDRVDLKHSPILTNNNILIDGVSLVKQLNPNSFIYNVNPSIWKTTSFIDLLSNFRSKTYRTIEDIDTQIFCMKYNIYKTHTPSYLKCGYYNCTEFFKFLHISHSGTLLSSNENCCTVYGQSCLDIKEDLTNILNKYFNIT